MHSGASTWCLSTCILILTCSNGYMVKTLIWETSHQDSTESLFSHNMGKISIRKWLALHKITCIILPLPTNIPWNTLYGSFSCTSKAAARMRPCLRAAARESSSTRPPRAVFTKNAPVNENRLIKITKHITSPANSCLHVAFINTAPITNCKNVPNLKCQMKFHTALSRLLQTVHHT